MPRCHGFLCYIFHARRISFLDQADRPNVSLVSQRLTDIITLCSLTLMLNLFPTVPILSHHLTRVLPKCCWCPESNCRAFSVTLCRILNENRD